MMAAQQDPVGYRFEVTSQQTCNNSPQLQDIPWRSTCKLIHHPGIFSGADQNPWRMILHTTVLWMCHRTESRKSSHGARVTWIPGHNANNGIHPNTDTMSNGSTAQWGVLLSPHDHLHPSVTRLTWEAHTSSSLFTHGLNQDLARTFHMRFNSICNQTLWSIGLAYLISHRIAPSSDTAIKSPKTFAKICEKLADIRGNFSSCYTGAKLLHLRLCRAAVCARMRSNYPWRHVKPLLTAHSWAQWTLSNTALLLW